MNFREEVKGAQLQRRSEEVGVSDVSDFGEEVQRCPQSMLG